MNSTKIFYFSGTGNSYKVAKALASELKCESIPIQKFNDSVSVELDAEKIGIVFPAFYMRIPRIVERFLNKIEDYQNKYIFTVVTVAGISGPIFKRISEIINKKNGCLSAGFIVRMPPSYLTDANLLPSSFQEAILRKANFKIRKVVSYVNDSKAGKLESFNPIFTLLFRGLIEKRFSDGFFEATIDRNFSVDEKCSNCNSCIELCPVNNITRIDGKLTWNGKCEKCLACINWCPQKAIQFSGVPENRQRYHHPEVTIKELIDIQQL